MTRNPDGPLHTWKTPRLDLICSLILSVEWLFFSSMHFTRPAETAAEIPEFFPYKSAIVVISGVIEIAAGILILFPRTRKAAAGVSLALLVAFVPSILKMMVEDGAMAGFEPWQGFMRVVLIPNHVLLGLAAVHLLRSHAATAEPTWRLAGD
jgi:uncharacterized membrane protein